jgi:hypothetical protein
MIIKKWLIISLLSMAPGALVAQRVDDLSYKKTPFTFARKLMAE